MPELGPYGSVRGARGNSRPYRESRRYAAKPTQMTHSGSRETLSLNSPFHCRGTVKLFFELYCHDGESFMRASAARPFGP